MNKKNINKLVKKPKVLSVFDFDGTLTYCDSFILFLYFAFSKRYFVKHIICMIPYIFRYMQNRLTRNELKEILVKTFLTNLNENWLCIQAENFCRKYWKKIIRPTGILAVIEELNAGAEVTICSASPDIILKPFADKLGINLIATKLEVENGRLTGRIIGHNCRSSQKLVMLESIYGNLNNYYLRAWGDTSGDYELLAAAQDKHWRSFHKTNFYLIILIMILVLILLMLYILIL